MKKKITNIIKKSKLGRNIAHKCNWIINFESPFIKFMTEFKKENNINYNELIGNIGIIVQPWVNTPAPFFSIVTGLFLMKKGKRISFILDDIEFGDSSYNYNIQLKSIKKVLSKINKKIKILKLSEVIKCDDENNTFVLEKLINLNTIHYMKGELKEEGRKVYSDKIESQLKEIYPKINTTLRKDKFDYLLVSGGIYGSSGVYLQIASEENIRVSTFDSGFGVLLSSTNGIASQLYDIPTAFRSIEKKDLEKIVKLGEEELENRKKGKDKFLTQKVKYSENGIKEEVGFLLLLNSVWDSAALGIHTAAFDSTNEWILETINYILKNTQKIITIREHPAERYDYQRSNDNYSKLIFDKFGKNERIKFISGYEDVNTYNLIEKSIAVIVFSTTTALEAVYMDKPVICVSNCYYSDLDIVFKAKSREEYYNLINRAIKQELIVDIEMKNNAIKCYYMTQRCNWLFTDYTPSVSDYKKWVKRSPDMTFNLPEVQDYLKSIDENIPLAFLRYKRNIKEKEE